MLKVYHYLLTQPKFNKYQTQFIFDSITAYVVAQPLKVNNTNDQIQLINDIARKLHLNPITPLHTKPQYYPNQKHTTQSHHFFSSGTSRRAKLFAQQNLSSHPPSVQTDIDYYKGKAKK